MNAANAIVFEGATADAHETTLSIVDPTGDHTQYLINQGGYIPVLAAATTTAITSTPAELNLLDDAAANSVVNSKAVIYGSSGELAGTLSTAAQGNVTSLGTLTALTVDNVVINGATIGHGDDTDLMTVADGVLTVAGELDAATLDISGNADIDGTLEADAITVDGTTLAEYIADTAGAMVSSNTETGITVTYQDGDNTIDFAVDAAQTGITSVYNTSLAIGYGSSHANIDFGTDNRIVFDIDGTSQILLLDGVFRPTTDSDVDLGSSAKYWKDAYIDTITTTGAITSGSNLVIANAGNIGSAGDTDAIAIASDGVVTFSQVPVLPNNTIETADIQDNAVTLAKMAGLARGKIIYGDSSGDPAALAVGSANYVLTSDGTDIAWAAASGGSDPSSADGDSLGTASAEWSDLYLADGGIIYFGNDQEITLTHVADDGLVLKHVGTGDGKEPSFSFHAGDNDIAADDVLGSIFFKAPDEGAGTDAVLVAAGLEAVSEGDFSSSSNATSLHLKTGSSEAATSKVKVRSDGGVTLTTALGSSSNATASTLYSDNIVKAWGHATGTGTVSLVDDHNVASITDNGTGDYTFAIGLDMANANYAGITSMGATGSCFGKVTPAAGTIQIESINDSGSATDQVDVMFVIVGENE